MIKKLFPAFVLLSVLLLGVVFMAKDSVRRVSEDESVRDFLITKGSSASKIGNDLQKQGFIKSSLAFKIYVQFTGKQDKIAAGEFRLSPSYSLFETVSTLQKGPVEIWVTIPEGLRHEEIAQKFADALGKDQEFVDEFVLLSSQKEGYLFPDTYLFPKQTTPEKIVDKLTTTFTLKAGEDMTNNQVIMASIIERETKGNEEKPVVAGILYKRLQNGWPLQVDASIQYAKGNWVPILISDKQLNSAYNTYKYTGLPPGPISNPGLVSIKAAVDPVDSEYWYYLHEDDGTIHYAKTLEGHNENIDKYL